MTTAVPPAGVTSYCCGAPKVFGHGINTNVPQREGTPCRGHVQSKGHYHREAPCEANCGLLQPTCRTPPITNWPEPVGIASKKLLLRPDYLGAMRGPPAQNERTLP